MCVVFVCVVCPRVFAHHMCVEDRVRCCVFCIASHPFALGWAVTEPEAHCYVRRSTCPSVGVAGLKSVSRCPGGSRTGPRALRGSHLSSLPRLVVVRIPHLPTHYFSVYVQTGWFPDRAVVNSAAVKWVCAFPCDLLTWDF